MTCGVVGSGSGCSSFVSSSSSNAEPSRSRAGRGATFVAAFPARDAGQLALPSERLLPSNGPELDRIDVLVIVIDGDSRDLLAALIAQYGAAITSASDAATAAVQMYESKRPHGLISGLGLPDQDDRSLV